MHDRLQVIIVGAGPYGLSVAAHVKAAGLRFRIFGTPMSTWREQMPKGMYLKSDGFASSLSDPTSSFTLKHYCAQLGIPYDDTRIPVPLETFTAYGVAFQQKFVPELEDRQAIAIAPISNGYSVTLDSGEIVEADKVVLAVGISHFDHLPPHVRHLPPSLLSHSSAHNNPECFRGRNVTVLGAGASALDLVALLHEAGAHATLLARASSVHFHDRPGTKPRGFWKRLRHPQSGIGPGMRARFYTDAPLLFHKLPVGVRLKIVRTHLRPAAGWPMKDRVMGQVPLLLGYSIEGAEPNGDRVRLHLVANDGTKKIHTTDHVIAATGYKADLRRLAFLDENIRARIASVENSPVLSTDFQSSVRGLYFVGLAAANSFGPMLRFAFGSEFTARHLSKHLARSANWSGWSQRVLANRGPAAMTSARNKKRLRALRSETDPGIEIEVSRLN
jgi:thioredoxin reductase